jgi:hypothetical protein
VNLFIETFFFFLPLLGIACIPLGIAVVAFDWLLYSRWVPVMRTRMSERKWPAFIIAFAPLLIFPTRNIIERNLPAALLPILASPWPIALGGIFCVAFAACWLKLPVDEEEDAKAPPARSLTGEWLLAVALIAANYIVLRFTSEQW